VEISNLVEKHSMTTILIIEDEALAARDLQKILVQCDAHSEVVSVLQSVQEATAWFGSNSEPDLLFCDIQLADGVSFDLFNLVQIDCPVIFTTAYDEYALRAFKLNSIDYLLKPIDREELERALAKFHRWKAQNIQLDIRAQVADAVRDLQNISTNAHSPTSRFKYRFLVHGKGAMLIIPAQEVAIFLKDEVIYLITLDGKRHLTDYQTMEEIEECANPADFFRANRQTIVHLQAVEGFKTEFTGKVQVGIKNMPQLSVDVSREKAGAFKKWLG
jgi:two-component system, LytTR family, response regulator